MNKYKEILDQIASDLADYQNEKEIGRLGHGEWQDIFVGRVINSITEYETIPKPPKPRVMITLYSHGGICSIDSDTDINFVTVDLKKRNNGLPFISEVYPPYIITNHFEDMFTVPEIQEQIKQIEWES